MDNRMDNRRGGGRGNRGGQNQYQPRDEFEEQVVKISRVSKKTKGGNKIGFSALAVVGDRKGRVGVGLGKAPDVSSAIRKGLLIARKHLITVPIVNDTIPYRVDVKVGAAKIMLKPAPPGSGVIAGGAVRSVVTAAGIKNVSSKVLGTNNQSNNVHATLEALRMLAARHEDMKIERSKKEQK